MNVIRDTTRREFLNRGALLTAATFDVSSGPVKTIYTYDATPLQALDLANPANAIRIWDTMHVLAALQGIVNRDGPRLYLFYCSAFNVSTDRFWLDWLQSKGQWLHGSRFTQLNGVEQAVTTFREHIGGLVVYDPAVPATSNLGSTIAGCEHLIPVRYDPSSGSMYTLLTKKLRLPVRISFLNRDGSSRFTGRGTIQGTNQASSGSAKADAYYWALKFYLESGKCNPLYAADYVDAYWLKEAANSSPDMHTLSNHDYFISQRAFFFDLSPWADEKPIDDPRQTLGTDLAAMQKILLTLYRRTGGREMIKIGGFPPWPFKYTSSTGGAHRGVPTEWQFAKLASEYNCYMEADAAGAGAMANASFYRHYPLAPRYRQPNLQPTAASWRGKGYLDSSGKVAPKVYVGHYVGDYDAPSWFYKAVPAFFADPARGQVPLNWAFDPNLADRAPQAFVYAYRNAKSTDFFIAGDSGAGYVNPRALSVRPESGLPPGLGVWTKHCAKYFERWGMNLTGFIIDGTAGKSTDVEYAAYRLFSPKGVGTQLGSSLGTTAPGLRAGVPVCPEHDLPRDANQAAALIAGLVKSGGGPQFLWLRSILMTLSWYSQLSRILQTKYPRMPFEVVDAYTFFGLIERL